MVSGMVSLLCKWLKVGMTMIQQLTLAAMAFRILIVLFSDRILYLMVGNRIRVLVRHHQALIVYLQKSCNRFVLFATRLTMT